MTSFAALMALSATQTRQSEAAVQSQLAERERRQAALRKQQEEKERKEREMEAKLRKKMLEEAQREKERQERLEAERRAKEAALRRKEEEQRDALRYGPKRTGSGYPSSSSGARSDVRRQRMPESDDEGGGALTREEKRQMRLKRELNYGLSASKRGAGGGYKKSGRRLPGGAVDTDAAMGGSSSAGGSGGYRSVRDRLAHEPPGLIRLNVNKRDTRTIDEILQDRAKAKAKILSGDDAKQFDDWFGKAKAKTTSSAASPPSSIFSSRSPSPAHDAPLTSQHTAKSLPRTTKSLSGTPPAASRLPPAKASTSTASTSKSAAPLVSRGPTGSVKPGVRAAEKSVTSVSSSSRPVNGKTPVKTVLVNSKTPSSARPAAPAARPSAGSSKAPAAAMKKRQRSPSLSDSPPPPKRRSQQASNSISAEIWKMFGKDRNAYVARDVFSDDEDMEAGARDLESEEMYSARIARREDELAMEEERRHEEEKRRRKKEREMRERRG